MKITVVIQYVGHVVHAGGLTTYRTVEIELTDEQAGKLKLACEDESYATAIISDTAA